MTRHSRPPPRFEIVEWGTCEEAMYGLDHEFERTKSRRRWTPPGPHRSRASGAYGEIAGVNPLETAL